MELKTSVDATNTLSATVPRLRAASTPMRDADQQIEGGAPTARLSVTGNRSLSWSVTRVWSRKDSPRQGAGQS